MASVHKSVLAVKTSALLGVVALFVTACGGAASPGTSAGASGCQTQLTRWRDSGGQAGMQAVRAAVVQYGQAVDVLAYGVPSAANLSQLATAAAGLEAQGERARADLPPACLPGLRDSYAASLGDFIRAAQGAKDSAQALQNGDVQQADSDAQASTSALEAGLQAMRKAANYLSGPEASR